MRHPRLKLYRWPSPEIKSARVLLLLRPLCIWDFSGDGTLDRYETKLDAVENGSFPPAKEVADFEQAIELTGKTRLPPLPEIARYYRFLPLPILWPPPVCVACIKTFIQKKRDTRRDKACFSVVCLTIAVLPSN